VAQYLHSPTTFMAYTVTTSPVPLEGTLHTYSI